MSDFSVLLGRVRANLLESGTRYLRATTTSAGAADGTTMISTTLSELDDAWNNTICRIITGDTQLNGLKRYVEDFTASSDTLTFTNNTWPKQVGTSVTFELFEPGIWEVDDLRNYIEIAGNMVIRAASPDLLVNCTVQEDGTASSGVVSLPDNILKFVDPAVRVAGRAITILDPEAVDQLTDDPFIDSSAGHRIGYFRGRSSASADVGQFVYIPAGDDTVTFNFVERQTFDTSNAWKVPEELWEPVVFLATALALQANERPELAKGWEEKAFILLRGYKDIEKPS